MQRDFMWLSIIHLELIHYACGTHMPSSATDHKFPTHLLVAIMNVFVHLFLLCIELLHMFSTN
jgi:hypothetical protein